MRTVHSSSSFAMGEGGGVLPQCMLGYILPHADTPRPGPGYPHPLGRQPPRVWAWTPPGRHPLALGLDSSPPPWAEFLAHACENITFPQLRLQTVSMVHRMLNFINLFDLLLSFQNHIRCLPHMTLDFGPVIFIQLVHLSHCVI